MPVYTYTTLDDPFATGTTSAFGINDSGQIVGQYSTTPAASTASSTAAAPTPPSTIPWPPAAPRHSGINDAGQIVGDYDDSQQHPRLPLQRRQLTPPSTIPWPTNGTSATRHQRCGPDRRVLRQTPAARSHGFLLTAAAPTPPSTIPRPAHGTIAHGINNAGQIVGYYIDSSGKVHGFLLQRRHLHHPRRSLGHRRHRCIRHQRRGPDRRVLHRRQRHPARLPLQRRHLHHPRRSLGHQRHRGVRHQQRGPDRRVLHRRQRHVHGFLLTITPNPPPPAGTTADMILRARTVPDGGPVRDLRHRQQRDPGGLPVGPGRNRLAVCRPRRLLRQRHHRHAVAQRQHRRLRGLRHQQQLHHQRRLPGHGRVGLAGHGLRQFLEPRRNRHDAAQRQHRRRRGLRSSATIRSPAPTSWAPSA